MLISKDYGLYYLSYKMIPSFILLAYAGHSLSFSEKHYAITELIAVIWKIAQFRYHLYGNRVTVYTDHAIVIAVLGAPNLSRW